MPIPEFDRLPRGRPRRPFVCSSTGGGLDAAWVHVAGALDIATTPQLERTLSESRGAAGRARPARPRVHGLRGRAHDHRRQPTARARDGRRLILLRGIPHVDRVFALTGNADEVEIGDLDLLDAAGADAPAVRRGGARPVSATAPLRGPPEMRPDRARDVGARRAHDRLRRSRPPRSWSPAGWRGAGRCTGMTCVVLAITYTLTGLGITVGFHRLFTHRSFKTTRARPRAARRARLDGGRGPADRVGLDAPQAPPLLGRSPATRTARTSTRRRDGAARCAGSPTRTSAGCSAARTWPTPRATPRTCSPTATCASSAAPSRSGSRSGMARPVRPRRRAHRLAHGRAHRAAVGRRRARPPAPPRDLLASTRCATSSAGGRSPPATSRATSPGSPRSRSARPGTTTTTPSPLRRDMASDAGRSIPAPG